ncbi:hypothetical protein [Paenibacillus ihumii]|uniref:hypothetical protein n=1 Tax=Paenibacillus ihumii TaxID=687436 RepID=UPI0006D769D7|nr:hypothetical protein [Paenibacillus ihumii]
MKNTNRFSNKKDALKAAMQAGAAHDYAVFKSRRSFKRPASDKKAYERGSIGPSAIATAIAKEFGRILSRRERKQLAKDTGKPFQKFYARG